MPQETQRSVYDTCQEHYPGESVEQMFINLVEEVVELGCILGLSEERMVNSLRITVAKSNDPVGDPEKIAKEIGDVGISILNLSEELGVDVMTAVSAAVAEIRSRSPEESHARAMRKRGLGLVG